MNIEGWKYYNHAALPTSAPHELPNLAPVEDGSIWKLSSEGKVFLARWTTNWDCSSPTNWWYVIKDSAFETNALKSKRRYEINKGRKNFSVYKINPKDYYDELYDVTVKAYSGWPEYYRPEVSYNSFFNNDWDNKDVFAGFSKTNNTMIGYAVLVDNGSFLEFSILRTNPEYERLGINAAMVAGILDYYNDRFDGDFYINDGERSIRHETAFQDYLEKYFGFRKAYCDLHIQYFPLIIPFVKAIYCLRNYISNESRIGNYLCALITLEEIRNSFVED